MVVRSKRNAKLRVVRSKQSQRATLGSGSATGYATLLQPSNLKTAAARVLARNSACNSLATMKIKAATYGRAVECKKLHDLNRDDVSRVLTELSDINLYRIGERLGWRSEPTEQQARLLVGYRSVLLELLRPRLDTTIEAGRG